ncbi:MAG: hypothetical protein RI885_2095 [Actinomycetota bacterium]|jgi:hypothetical protein
MDIPITPAPVAEPPRLDLRMIGDPVAASCVGDFCTVPDHHTQAVVNRRIDEGEI